MDLALLGLLVMVGTLLLSAALVPLTRAVAGWLGVMDGPGHRKVHAVPMPRMGGLAVYVAFTSVVIVGL